MKLLRTFISDREKLTGKKVLTKKLLLSIIFHKLPSAKGRGYPSHHTDDKCPRFGADITEKSN